MYTERKGIIRKCVLALKTVIEASYDYMVPDSAEQSLNEFKIENDSVLLFINECVAKRPTLKLDNYTTKIMYDVYKEWCKDNNNGHTENKSTFKKTFTEYLGYKTPNDTVVKDNNTYYRDYTLSL